MKRFSKKIALLLAILTCLSALSAALVGCQPNEQPGDETTAEETTDSGSTPNQDGKVTHTITVNSAGGMALDKLNIYIYTDETLEDLVNYTTTNEAGEATISLVPSDKYVAVLTGLPEGYKAAPYYPLTGTTTKISVTSGVVESTTDHTGITYTLGSVMRDFSVTDTEGNTLKLSELLKTKKMVLINFWYSECNPCISEFPYMNAAYEQYKDTVEIVALSHYGKDTEEVIAAFKEEHGLSFPMARDYTTMATAFGIQYYPTSIVVDRYGVICLIEEGAIVSDTPFNAIFNHFSAADYKQELITDLEQLVPREKPTVEMPSSEDISAAFTDGKLTATFSPETSDQDAEYSWPFIISEKDGAPCIVPSNTNKHSSYATMYISVNLKKGEALAFDYFNSTEAYSDILYTLAKRNDINGDTYKDIYQISGIESKWNTCYTFVANDDGEYSIGLCYIKDASENEGDDTVYLKNLRVVDVSAIDVPTYIPRYAANDLSEDHSTYQNYATVVYNEADGLYHVGTKDGPLLFADLMKATRFSQTSIYYFALDGKIVLDGKNYLEEIIPYASYASNSLIAGLCPVNQELKELLVITAQALGIETDNENQWLQMCSYYDAYGTNGVQLEDPTKGLYTTDENNIAIIDPHKAFEAQLGENSINYNRMIMPRGLVSKFIPTESGAYRIASKGEFLVEGWIFNEDGTEYYVYEGGERLYTDENNISMVVYLEAGKCYYIDVCYYDVYQMGILKYDIEYLGPQYEYFTIASPGYFTFPDGSEVNGGIGDLAEIINGGIDIVLGEDGFYHELRKDGSIGSILYVDVISTSAIFGQDSIETLIAKKAFDFTYSDSDEYIMSFIAKHGDNTKAYLKEYWGEQYEALAKAHALDDVLNGIYHGSSSDKTEAIKAIMAKKIPASETEPELEGCIKVDAELAALLQELMDKYSFAGVDHSWTKLCYYYQLVGA